MKDKHYVKLSLEQSVLEKYPNLDHFTAHVYCGDTQVGDAWSVRVEMINKDEGWLSVLSPEFPQDVYIGLSLELFVGPTFVGVAYVSERK